MTLPTTTPSVTPADILSQLSRVKAEVDRRRWLADPVLWANERLGIHVWSKQREILRSIRDNRLTAVHSCHNSGKSFIAAVVVCWFLDVHPPGEAFVVTTSARGRQVETVLWRNIRRLHIKGKLPGRTNRTEWLMPIPGSTDYAGKPVEEQVAFGHRPADMDPTGMHGIHAPYVLLLYDEATGIPKPLWDAGDSLVSNEDSRWCAFANPDDPVCEFAEICKPGTGWNVIRISAFETPNYYGHPEFVGSDTDSDVPEFVRKQLVSPVWVEEKKKRWGEKNPLYTSKVLGEFPDFADDGLIPVRWVRDAQENQLPAGYPTEMGVDVGGGGDKTVVALRRGPAVEIVHEDREPNTMATTGVLVRLIRQYGPSVVRIDTIGIGRGLVDRLKEQKDKLVGVNIVGVNVGERARRDGYLNLRADGYWNLREKFQAKEICIPDDDDLVAQLIDIRFESVSSGLIKIESKDDMKRRGKSSPDKADAVMLAMMDTGKKKSLTWGRRKP